MTVAFAGLSKCFAIGRRLSAALLEEIGFPRAFSLITSGETSIV